MNKKYPRKMIQAINQKVSVTELLKEYFGLKVYDGGSFVCPFHPDSSPSAKLYPDNAFYCFGCGKQFTPFAFLQRVEASDEVLMSLAGEFGEIEEPGDYKELNKRVLKYAYNLRSAKVPVAGSIKAWRIFYERISPERRIV